MVNKSFFFLLFYGIVLNLNAQSNNSSLFKSLNNNLVIYSTDNYKKLQNSETKKILLDSISDIVLIDNMNCLIARTDHYEQNGDYIITSGWNLYDLNGKKIIKEDIDIMETVNPNIEGGTLFMVPSHSKNKKIIILEQKDHGYGVIDITKGIIIPFQYFQIEISEDQRKIIAYEKDSKNSIIFDFNGKKIK